MEDKGVDTTVIEKWAKFQTYVHSVSYVYAVLPFYDVKCLCSGGGMREGGKPLPLALQYLIFMV